MKYTLIDDHGCSALKPFVKKIYLLSSKTEEVYGCIPNGHVGISIILSGSGYIKDGASWKKQPDATIYGLVRRAQFHKMSDNFRELNINFDPHLLQLFIKEPLSALDSSNGVDLYELFPRQAIEQLREGLSIACSAAEISTAVNLFLMPFLQQEKPDSRPAFAHDLIALKHVWRVDQLSAGLNISSTALRNLFRDKIGIPPKDLIRIHRIKKSLEAQGLHKTSMTALAYSLDYFDQSHFIHDFKEAIGLTPKHYFQNEKLSFDFYNYGRWRSDSFATI